MVSCVPTHTLAQPFWPVKSTETSSIDGSPRTMTHHKVSLSRKGNMIVSYSRYRCKAYGVSSSYRILTKGLFHKRFDQIMHCLTDILALTPGKCEATLGLLRFWAYYGEVYPKASQTAFVPGCSKSTFWRAVADLKSDGLIKTIPRFVIRPHAQISNLYRLDKLLILIARYLAEHGTAFLEKWLTPILTMPGRQFYHWVFHSEGGVVI